MKKTVSPAQAVGGASGLPPRVQEALGELVEPAKEGLLALSVGVGLSGLTELMEEVGEVVGPKGKHDPERVAAPPRRCCSPTPRSAATSHGGAAGSPSTRPRSAPRSASTASSCSPPPTTRSLRECRARLQAADRDRARLAGAQARHRPPPVYHRKEERIRSHVLLCFLDLLLTRIAEGEAKESWPTIRRELQRMHLGEFHGSAGRVLQRTEIRPAQREILSALAIDEPPRFLAIEPAKA